MKNTKDDVGRSGSGNYKGEAFTYFQGIQFLIDKITNNSTRRNMPWKNSNTAAIPIICPAITFL